MYTVGKGHRAAQNLIFHGEKHSSSNSLQGKCLNNGPFLQHEHVELLNVPYENIQP